MKRGFNTLVVLVVFVFAICFSTLVLSADEPTHGETLVVATDRDILNIDPHQWTANATRKVMLNVYEGLVRQDEQLNIIPQLAKSWEISEDGVVYTFHLKQGVKFHNGREFVADDVKYSIERILKPETGHPYIEDYRSIKNIEIVDKYTIRIEFKYKTARGLQYLAGNWCSIVPKEEIEKYGDLKLHPCGTGPFKFKERVPEDHATLTRFEDYHEEGLPYLDEIIFKLIPEQYSRMADLIAGNSDIIYGLGPEISEELEGKPNISCIETPSSGVSFLYLNTQSAPFDNVKVRQAVNFGLNRAELAISVFGNIASPIAQLVPPSSPVPVKQIVPVYDPDKAKALLAEAGYPSGEVEFTFDSPIFSTAYEVLGDLVQLQLNQAGFNVKMNHIDPGTYEERVIRKKDFQMGLDGTSEHPDPDVKLFVRAYTGAVTNIAGYSNKRVDELLKLGQSTIDLNKRTEIYNEVLQILYEEAPIIPLVTTKWVLYNRDRVHNLKADMLTMLQLKNVWVEQ